jgi:hypothetical protein
MNRLLGRVGWRQGVVGALVAVCCGGGAAFAAATAAAPGEIMACADTATGTMRLAKAASDCHATESSVSWNKQGVAGPQGLQGVKGATGAAGQKGATGAIGATGAQGVKGATGAVGPMGAAGVKGATGAMGPAGAKGATGAAGAKGAAGAAGSMGPMGANGAKGDKGDTGAAGAMGPAGAKGATGAVGAAGAKGATGATGSVGATGPQGPQGPQGAPGPEGPEGPEGPAVNVPVAVGWPTPYDVGTGAFYLNLNGFVVPLKSFGGCRDQVTEYQDCYFELSAAKPVLDWISQTLAASDPGPGGVGAPVLKSLEVLAVDVAGKISSRMRLGNSFWREVTFGDADATSKAPLTISMIVVPGAVSQIVDGATFTPPAVAKGALASTFRLDVGGPVRFAREVTGLTIDRAKMAAPRVGPNPPTHRGFEPGSLSFSQIVVSETKDEGLAQTIDDALQDNAPLFGELTFLDITLKNEVFTIDLASLTPLGRLDAFPVNGARSVTLAVNDAELSSP